MVLCTDARVRVPSFGQMTNTNLSVQIPAVSFGHLLNFCREEGEKFNIWQAWLNLENMYGSPTPDEAVTRLFQKALPYCDAKKLYLALLDILERTNKVSCSPACAVALQLSLILH